MTMKPLRERNSWKSLTSDPFGSAGLAGSRTRRGRAAGWAGKAGLWQFLGLGLLGLIHRNSQHGSTAVKKQQGNDRRRAAA